MILMSILLYYKTFVGILINLYVGAQTEVCELILTRFCSLKINNMQFYNIRMKL
jgi:hypothetical protein